MAKAKKKRPPGPPRRQRNEDVRGREHLEEKEVDKLRDAAARCGRNGHRDATMILMAYRHGLRVSELVRLRWDQVHFDDEDVYIRRRKGSDSGMHVLAQDEIKALRKLGPDRAGWVFKTEGAAKGKLSESGFFKIVRRAGETAGLDFPVHPHMLRHACGYAMNREGQSTRTIQAWLGHKNIQHTVRYTSLDADHFRKSGVWGSKPRP